MTTKLLFDISPDDVPAVKKAQKRKRAESPAQEQQPPIPQPRRNVSVQAIGRLDGVHRCDNEKCRGSAHDILYEDHGEWLIQCCFCNWTQWVEVIEWHIKDDYRLSAGVFAGMTLKEVAEQPDGIAYIKLSAKKHQQKKVREECEAWLDQNKHAS